MDITQRSAARGCIKGVVGRLRFLHLVFPIALACNKGDGTRRDTTNVVLVPPQTIAVDSVRVQDSLARARTDSANRAKAGYVIDSARTVVEYLRRFRIDLPEVSEFTEVASSKEELVKQFQEALSKANGHGLDRLVITRGEFGWLIYPESPASRPPYAQDAEIVWGFIQLGSSTGRQRLLSRAPTLRIVPESLSCEPEPERQGRNRLWAKCSVRLQDDPSQTRRLFGTIIERGGRFKFLSLTNGY